MSCVLSFRTPHSLFREGEAREKCFVCIHLQRDEVRGFPLAPQKTIKNFRGSGRVSPGAAFPVNARENMSSHTDGPRLRESQSRALSKTKKTGSPESPPSGRVR